MDKNKKQIIMLISWTALLLWLVLLFYLSDQPAAESDGLSKKVTEVIIETVGRLVPLDIESSTTADLVPRFNHIARKFAHFGVYFVLGVLMMNSLRISGMRGRKAFILSIVFCVIYAVSDEVHQLFVPGRGAQVKDVLIDSAGAIVGIWLRIIITC